MAVTDGADGENAPQTRRRPCTTSIASVLPRHAACGVLNVQRYTAMEEGYHVSMATLLGAHKHVRYASAVRRLYISWASQ